MAAAAVATSNWSSSLGDIAANLGTHPRTSHPPAEGPREGGPANAPRAARARLSIRCSSITQNHTPASHREFLDSHWPIYSPLLLRGDASQLAPPRYGPLWPLTFSPKEPNA